jgi:hypothetical protein
MGIFTSKEEAEAIVLSRKQITETRDTVIIDHAKLNDHCDTFDAHVIKGEATVEKIFNEIANQKCPKHETIKVLEDYKKDMNGHLKDIAQQSLEQKETLNALVNQTKGVECEKEKRNKKWTMWTAMVGALIACCVFYYQLSDIKDSKIKDNAIVAYKIEQLEEKVNE